MRAREYPVLKFKEEDPLAIIPKYMTEGAAGFDFYALDTQIVPVGSVVAVRTGLSCEIPPGWEIQIRPRSGLAYNFGHYIPNAPGTIDADYRGEIKIMIAPIIKAMPIHYGERIAQGVMSRAPQFDIVTVHTVSNTERGSGGFGSTG